MTREEQIARGHRAHRLLEDEDVKQAFLDVKAQLFADFCSANPGDILNIHYKEKALRLLYSQLDSWRTDARMR